MDKPNQEGENLEMNVNLPKNSPGMAWVFLAFEGDPSEFDGFCAGLTENDISSGIASGVICEKPIKEVLYIGAPFIQYYN